MPLPFMKYVGGSREIADDVLARFPCHVDTYVEPFLGGGAVFWAAAQAGALDGKLVLLGDADRDVIELWVAVKKTPIALLDQAREHADTIEYAEDDDDAATAYEVLRDLWNLDLDARDPGLNLCLRYACFNGLWRTNRDGGMNVSWNKKRRPELPSMDRLEACSDVLQALDVELLDWDFREYESREDAFLGPGCVIYIDPPYAGEGAFRDYRPEGFTIQDQAELLELAAIWAGRGARIIYSQADTPETRELVETHLPGATIDTVAVRRQVNRDGEGRAPVSELLVTANGGCRCRE